MPPDAIFIVHTGEIDRNIGDETVETLGPRSVFGEEQILHGKPQEFDYVTAGPCRIYEVRGEDIVGIPIVMWKLLETFELRSAAQQAGAFVRSILPRHGETGTDVTAAAAQ